jgi:glycosyltransferase involved in cell wall biosynthesis
MIANLTAVIFTYNRREIVETALRSARLAEHLVVVDKGSTDGTAEIAKRYADEFHTAPWSPTVESTKAQYIPRIDSDWLLTLDDDECLNGPALEYIRTAVSEGSVDVHYLPYRHYILGRHDERAYYWPEYRPALFRRGSMTFAGTVHGGTQRVSESYIYVPPETGVSILHLSHAGSRNWLEKTNRYTDELDRASTATASDLTPDGVKRLLDNWLNKVPEGGEPYLTAVAALRAVYDIVDSVKCWEQQQAQRGEQAFELIVEQLHKEYDLIGIDRGRRRAATQGKAVTTR